MFFLSLEGSSADLNSQIPCREVLLANRYYIKNIPKKGKVPLLGKKLFPDEPLYGKSAIVRRRLNPRGHPIVSLSSKKFLAPVFSIESVPCKSCRINHAPLHQACTQTLIFSGESLTTFELSTSSLQLSGVPVFSHLSSLIQVAKFSERPLYCLSRGPCSASTLRLGVLARQGQKDFSLFSSTSDQKTPSSSSASRR